MIGYAHFSELCMKPRIRQISPGLWQCARELGFGELGEKRKDPWAYTATTPASAYWAWNAIRGASMQARAQGFRSGSLASRSSVVLMNTAFPQQVYA